MSDNAKPEHQLAVTDIELRGELISFIVVDRFHDGDPGNNAGLDPSLSEPTCTDWGKYWGGDLPGVIDKLDYLQGLEVTAVWLTPLFEQVEAMVWDSAPIHGYRARDFKRIHARWVAGEDGARVIQAGFGRAPARVGPARSGRPGRGVRRSFRGCWKWPPNAEKATPGSTSASRAW